MSAKSPKAKAKAPPASNKSISLLDLSNHSMQKDIVGAIMVVVVALPAVLPYLYFLDRCSIKGKAVTDFDKQLCEFGLHHPVWFVNVLMFLSVDVAMWLYSVVIGSTWVIDPYWTIIPVMIGHFFLHHPLAVVSMRSLFVLFLVYVWAVRLTYNYFRREEWHFGVREDWRYAEMREHPLLKNHWWWLSFFAGFVIQHIMLFLASSPLWAIFFDGYNKPLGLVDFIGFVVVLTGITFELLADSELRDFMVENESRARNGEEKILILNSGVWYYSRHPNYFGEQTFWWGIFVFGFNVGHPETGIGALIISLLFFGASLRLVEGRMLRNEKRRELFKEYQRTTSAFLPLPKFPWFGGKQAKKQQ